MVYCVRALIAKYILDNAKVDFNGIPLEVALSALGFNSVSDFVEKDVMQWGAEAESLVQVVSPFALEDKLVVHMIQLDSSDAPNTEYTLQNDKALHGQRTFGSSDVPNE